MKTLKLGRKRCQDQCQLHILQTTLQSVYPQLCYQIKKSQMALISARSLPFFKL